MSPDQKRIRLVLLILLLILLPLPILLATYSKDPQTPPPTTTAPTEIVIPDRPVTLEMVAANLADADSLRLTISMINDADTFHYENTYTFQLLKESDGSQSVRYTQANSMTLNGQTVESVGDQAFYCGNVAYVHYAHSASSAPATKWICEQPFQMGTIVEDQSGLYLQSSKNSMVETFSALSPAKVAGDDGAYSYILRHLSKEQFAAVYAAFAGEHAAEEMFGSIDSNCSFRIQADVDARGFLTQFKMEILNVPTENGSQNITILFTIDQINTISIIDTPDYVENFKYVDGAEVVCLQDGITAHYRYSSTARNNAAGLVFVGFGDTYTDDYTVESYEILSEVDGMPVTAVHGVLNNTFCSVKVARLVIPAGIQVRIQGVYTGSTFESYTEETTLFFRDKKENVEKTFLTTGENAAGKEAVFFKAAYYAGQWELKDGIPAPNS